MVRPMAHVRHPSKVAVPADLVGDAVEEVRRVPPPPCCLDAQQENRDIWRHLCCLQSGVTAPITAQPGVSHLPLGREQVSGLPLPSRFERPPTAARRSPG